MNSEAPLKFQPKRQGLAATAESFVVGVGGDGEKKNGKHGDEELLVEESSPSVETEFSEYYSEFELVTREKKP